MERAIQVKRVAHIIAGLETGGAEHCLLRLVTALSKHNISNLVVALGKPGSLSPKVAQVATLIHLGLPSRFSIAAFFGVIRRIRADSYVVHTWMPHANVLFGIIGRVLGLRVVWAIHNALPTRTGYFARILGSIERLLSHFIPNLIICCSNASKQAYSNAGYNRRLLKVVFNGHETEAFSPCGTDKDRIRRDLSIPFRAPVAAHVGRWHPVKNHALLLDSFALVLKRLPNAHFIACGPEITFRNDALAQMVKKSGLPMERIHLLGLREDVPDILACADCVVLSSHSEAFPNVLCEALAAGKPAVSTDVGDAKDIIGDCGIIVSSANPDSFATAIVTCLELPAGIYAKAGPLKANAMFSMNTCVERHIAIYGAHATPK